MKNTKHNGIVIVITEGIYHAEKERFRDSYVYLNVAILGEKRGKREKDRGRGKIALIVMRSSNLPLRNEIR